VGETEMIPGFFFLRLYHVVPNSEKTICTKEETADHITYIVTYPAHNRSIAIEFEKKFPHQINRWTEKISKDGETFMTTATREKTMITDYWTKNSNEFIYLRDSLGLSHQNY
jgi:hypothetical protein